MSKILKPLAVAAVIVGAAVLTGGISLAPSISAFTAGGVAVGAVAGGIATTALGSALLSTAIGVALTGLSQAFTRSPRAGLSDLARLNLTQLAAAPRKMVLGDTAFAADLRYNEPSGSEQRYVDAIIHLASHRATRIRELRIGDKLAWTDTGGVQGEFAGFLTVELRPEAGPGAFHTVNGGARWGANTRLTGCATARIRIDRQGTKRTQSPFAGGLPPQVMFIGEGMPVYDPRRDSTVPGGSGAHRVNDQSTWQYHDGSTVLGSNLALMALAWRLGWRINGVVSCGLGNPVSRLDLAAFAAAANVCDELVTLAGGGTQRRYHGGGLISDDADKQAIEQAFADCVGGWWDDGRGALGLFVSVNDLAGAVVSLNDDDIQSPVKWDPFPELAETWNVVRGLNPEPALPANFQPTEYPEVQIPSLDGIDRVLQLNLAFIQDKRTPQRLAKQALQRAQYPALFSATFGTRGWLAKKGRVVELTCAKLGFAAELFRVVDRQKNVDGTVNLVLRKENPAIYQWAAEESPPVVPATPITYNPLNQPFVVATVAALNALDEIGADGVLHPQEKLFVIKEKAALDRRVTEVRGRMVTLGLSVAALDAASAALNGYLAGLTPAWNSSAAPTPIVRGTWNATWQAVYDQAEIGAAAVSAEDARRAIWPNVTGTGRPADNATVGAPQGTAVGGVPVEVGYALTPTGMFEDWNRHGTLAAAQRAWDFDNPAAVSFFDGDLSGGRGLSVNGGCTLLGKHRISYAAEDLYRVKARVFVSSLGQTHFVGVTAFDAGGNELTVTDGGSYHYFAGANSPSSTGWYEWEGYFRGRAAVGTGAAVGIFAPNPSAPNPVRTGAVTVAPAFVANDGPPGGFIVIDYIAIEKVEDLTALPSRTWAAGDFQKRGQVVTHLGRSWIARIDNTGVTPPSTSTGNATWALLSSSVWNDISGSGKPQDNADITSINVAAAVIGQGVLATQNTVSTNLLAANAVTSNTSQFTAGTVGISTTTFTIVQTVSVLAAAGDLVDIIANAAANFTGGPNTSINMRICRNGASIFSTVGWTPQYVSPACSDIPGAGTHIYTFEIAMVGALCSADISNRYLRALLIKR